MKISTFIFMCGLLIGASTAMVSCSSFDESELKLTSYSGVKLWPDGILIYQFDKNFNEDSKHKVQTAANNINNWTNVEIVSREEAEAKGYKIGHVAKIISNDNACWANIGYYDDSEMNIASGCTIGNIMHEFFHLLGIAHEQLNPDFKGNIRLDKVQPEYESQFTAERLRRLTNHDKLSIMHYDSWSFSICSDADSEKVVNSNDEKLKACAKKPDYAYDKECSKICAVIVDNKGQVITRQRDYLTDSDVAGIKKLYPKKK